jgi:hypothetical protein
VKRFILIILLLGLSLYAKNIATITALNGSAVIVRDGSNVEATLGAKLQEKDNIKTQEDSKVQIIFEDETIITIGKNSDFSIKEYVFDNVKKPVARFAMLKGAMRTITGKIGKVAPDKFSVKTKTATIGIRGTNFTVIAMADGSQRVFCTFGAISVKVNGAEMLVREGFFATVDAGKKVKVKVLTPQKLNQMRRQHFAPSPKPGDVGSPQKGTPPPQGTPPPSSSVDVKGLIPQGMPPNPEEILNPILPNLNEIVQDAEQINNSPDASIEKLSGYAVTGSDSNMAAHLIGIEVDGSNKFIEANSYLSTFDSSSQGAFKFNIASEPTSYVSTQEFSGTFSTITAINPLYENPNLIASSFTTTSDLSSSDDMSWGEWNAEYSYDFEGSPGSNNDSGFWIAGEPTDSSVIAGYSMSSAIYTGVYKGFNASHTSVNGVAEMDVNFGADTADLTIKTFDGGSDITYNMIGAGTNKISGNESGLGDGSAVGTFYGSSGNDAGGEFIVGDGYGSCVGKGVYQVHTNEVLH